MELSIHKWLDEPQPRKRNDETAAHYDQGFVACNSTIEILCISLVGFVLMRVSKDLDRVWR